MQILRWRIDIDTRKHIEIVPYFKMHLTHSRWLSFIGLITIRIK